MTGCLNAILLILGTRPAVERVAARAQLRLGSPCLPPSTRMGSGGPMARGSPQARRARTGLPRPCVGPRQSISPARRMMRAPSDATIRSYRYRLPAFRDVRCGARLGREPSGRSACDRRLHRASVVTRRAAWARTSRHGGRARSDGAWAVSEPFTDSPGSPTRRTRTVSAMRWRAHADGSAERAAMRPRPSPPTTSNGSSADIPTGTHAGRRDRAMLLVGFMFALSRSELVALDVDDVSFVTHGLLVGVTTRRADIDVRYTVPVANHEDRALCAGRALRAWLGHAYIDAGPVFRRVMRGDRLTTPGWAIEASLLFSRSTPRRQG